MSFPASLLVPSSDCLAHHPETAASVKIGAIGYRVRCVDAGCKNVGRLQMICADACGGRPIAHPISMILPSRLLAAIVRSPHGRSAIPNQHDSLEVARF